MICPYSHKWHWLKFRYSPRKVLRYNDQTNGKKRWRMTDNTMTKLMEKKDKKTINDRQNSTQETKIEQNEPHWKSTVNSGSPL